MNKMLLIVISVFISAFSAQIFAGDSDAEDAVRKALQKALPGVTPDEISPSPVAGLHEVVIGPRLLYITDDGRYLMQGSLIDLKTRINISEARTNGIRLKAVNAVGEENMVIFAPDKPKHTITVFTDIDCTYCRKLHKEMKDYNANGIAVRYLMYPRSGVDTASYYKAVSVWCDEDHQGALTRAKAGEKMPKRDCDNPIQAHMQLGEEVGLRGTPAIVMENGELLPGYVPADKLLKLLEAGT